MRPPARLKPRLTGQLGHLCRMRHNAYRKMSIRRIIVVDRLETAPSTTAIGRRQLLARLGLFTATLTAAPALAAKPTPPHCGKAGEQMLARIEYEKALNALPSEAELPLLRDLHERYSRRQLGHKPVPAVRAEHTANLEVYRNGQASAGRVTVLVHGCLSDHETWRYVAGALGEDHELWLVDLPGCGTSGGDPKHLEPDAFKPEALAERVGLVLEQCLAERAASGLPEPRITLVGHSLGGTLCLRLVSSPSLRNRFARVRQQVDALVLFAPCDVAINSIPPSFMTLLSLSPIKVGVGDALGIVDDQIKDLTRASYFQPAYATREQAEGFHRALTVSVHLRSAQAMVRTAVPWKIEENRPDWEKIAPLEADYANVDVPCLIAWGEWDETLPETMGHKIRDKVPGARLVEITGSGLSVISEKPLECVRIIRTCEDAVAGGRFAALPPVSCSGTKPFDGELTLAMGR